MSAFGTTWTVFTAAPPSRKQLPGVAIHAAVSCSPRFNTPLHDAENTGFYEFFSAICLQPCSDPAMLRSPNLLLFFP
jgi:hypothetical protein